LGDKSDGKPSGRDFKDILNDLPADAMEHPNGMCKN
jgi:hypothetical protein